MDQNATSPLGVSEVITAKRTSLGTCDRRNGHSSRLRLVPNEFYRLLSSTFKANRPHDSARMSLGLSSSHGSRRTQRSAVSRSYGTNCFSDF
jgi:hypothetical protein